MVCWILKREWSLVLSVETVPLAAMEFRPGVPNDYVMRGPTYAFSDYAATDSRVLEMERMLCTIFTDQMAPQRAHGANCL
jgi:hypothetical protein